MRSGQDGGPRRTRRRIDRWGGWRVNGWVGLPGRRQASRLGVLVILVTLALTLAVPDASATVDAPGNRTWQRQDPSGPAPAADSPAQALARRFAAGDETALAELRALGPDVMDQVRPVLVASPQALKALITDLTISALERSIEEQGTLIYHGQFQHLGPLAPEAAGTLIALLQDEDRRRALRARAAMALGDLGPRLAAEHRQSLAQALRELARDFLTEPWCAAEASYVCARLGDRSLVDKLIEARLATVEQPLTSASLPEILGAHTELSEVYYRIGAYADAVRHYQQRRVILQELRERLRPEFQPGVDEELALLDYNLACSLTLAGRLEDAMSSLEQALGHGTVTRLMVETDGDLRALRAHPDFPTWWLRVTAALDAREADREPDSGADPSAGPPPKPIPGPAPEPPPEPPPELRPEAPADAPDL